MDSPVPGGSNILVSIFYQTTENHNIFAGYSLLAVGMKFKPLDKSFDNSDISSLFNIHVLKFDDVVGEGPLEPAIPLLPGCLVCLSMVLCCLLPSYFCISIPYYVVLYFLYTLPWCG